MVYSGSLARESVRGLRSVVLGNFVQAKLNSKSVAIKLIILNVWQVARADL